MLTQLFISTKAARLKTHKVFSSKLLANSFFLTVIQIVNFIFPFLLYPRLASLFGVEIFGIVAFGFSIAQLVNVIVDYGFNLSATYAIAEKDKDKDSINKILAAVFACKSALLIIVCLGFVVFNCYFNKYTDFLNYFWFLILVFIGQAFQPVWFFQGIERMRYITVFTVASKLTFLLSVFLFISRKEQFYLVGALNGMSQIIAAGISIYYVKRLGYSFTWPGLKFTVDIFKQSTSFFLSRASMAIYSACSTVFLGLFSSPLQVAYYSAAEQIYKGGQAIVFPFSQALFPYMVKTKNLKVFFRISALVFIAITVGVLLIIFLGDQLIHLLFGSDFKASYPILVIYAVTLLLTVPSILIGYPLLGAFGYTQLANKSVIFGGLLQIALLVFFYFFKVHTAIWIVSAVLLTEVVVLGQRIWMVKSKLFM